MTINKILPINTENFQNSVKHFDMLTTGIDLYIRLSFTILTGYN